MAVTKLVPDLRGDQTLSDLPPIKRLTVHGLTHREAEIALLAGRGLLVREIAARLQVTDGTIKTLLARARAKLGCDSVRELARLLIRSGVVTLAELDETDGLLGVVLLGLINLGLTNNLPLVD